YAVSASCIYVFSLITPTHPKSTLFPYTTLFRSKRIGNRSVLFEPVQRRGVKIKDSIAVARDLLRVRLPMEHVIHAPVAGACITRSEEHTSELQSRSDLVCRLLLEKKNKQQNTTT